MVVCENCSATLEPKWKYCIHCGMQLAAELDEPDATHDPVHDETKPVGPLFVLGVIFAGIGLTILTIFLTLRG